MNARRLSPAILTGLSALPPLLLLPFRAQLPDGVLLVAVFITIVTALGISAFAWKRLDETAREAHKSAWFWGAPFGLLALFMALALLLLTPVGRDILDPAVASLHSARAPWSPETSAFTMGVVLAGCVQSLAYAGVWILWWMRRR